MPGHPAAPASRTNFPLLSRRKDGPWPAHRLDAETSGCLLIALRHDPLLAAQSLFASGGVRKTYWAVITRRGPGDTAPHGITAAGHDAAGLAHHHRPLWAARHHRLARARPRRRTDVAGTAPKNRPNAPDPGALHLPRHVHPGRWALWHCRQWPAPTGPRHPSAARPARGCHRRSATAHAGGPGTMRPPPIGFRHNGGNRWQTIEADYVVVGAGSAGCVMAARLSEDPGTKVVLLEAGGADPIRWIHIPLGYGKTFADPRVNWCYETEPDPGIGGRRSSGRAARCWAAPARSTAWSISAASTRISTTGASWAMPAGRSTTCCPISSGPNTRPRAGRLPRHRRAAGVSDVARTTRSARPSSTAPSTCGFPRNDDFNGAEQEGVGYYQTTTRNGRRCSTAVGYLRPAMKRPNLRVITHALTERMLFDGKRAVGVRIPPGRRVADRAARRGGDPVRRRHQLAAAADAVRHRPGGHLSEHGH